MDALRVDPEFKSLITELSADERTELEQSILAEGCRDALVTWRGVIVDGHNRYDICTRHDLPFQTTEREFADREAVKEWIIRNQFARRNLSAYDRSRLVLRLKDLIAERAKERQRGGQGGVLLHQNSDEANEPVNTKNELASTAGVSHDTIHKVEVIEREAPEPIKQKARAGEISTHRAYKMTQALQGASERVSDIVLSHDIDDPDTVAILRDLEASEKDPHSSNTFDEIARSGYIQPGDEEDAVPITETPLRLKEALAKKQKTHAKLALDDRMQKRREAANNAPPDTFNVIYCDPPWQYSNTGVLGAAARHYDTMSTEDICGLLGRLNLKVDDNAVLFMWATNPTLPDALRVIEAWGFEYKTNMVWVKTELVKPGSGFYVRGRHELLFVCTRGSFLPLEHVSPPIGSVVESPIREHSRKPEEFYTVIERLYPGCNYIELFARYKRDGWTSWGDQVHDAGEHEAR